MRKVEREFRKRDAIWKGGSQLRNHPWAHECHFKAPYTHFLAAKWAAKSPLGCKIVYENAPWPRNDLQASKWPSNYEIDLQNGGRFAETPYKAKESFKMPTEPRAPWNHIHQASHSISNLLKPSEPIAPAESSN